MTDHLEATRDRLGGLHDHLSRREVALAADDLHAILSAILDHLDAQVAASIRRGLDDAAAGRFADDEPEPDPLDESNHDDRYDLDGDRWVWCGECDGFRLGARHEAHESSYGWSAYGVNEDYGPLTFAPWPADTPTTAPQPDEAHGDAPDPARPAETHTAPDTYDVRLAWLGDEPIGSDADLDFCHWLGNICANAWGEGHRAGYADGAHYDDPRITLNPYRKGRA